MAAVTLFKYPVASPADTSPLSKLQQEGYSPTDVVALVGKTEGNGCVNDFSRTLAAHAWESNLPPSAVTVFSGGTEGVLSPHVSFLVRTKESTGLIAWSGHTRDFAPHEVGTEIQSQDVATRISKMIINASIEKEDVCLVLIKCPLLTSTDIEQIRANGQTPITADTYESMARSRYASAIGIALALGEIQAEVAPAALSSKENAVWSSRASCSSGAELKNCHIMVLARDKSGGNGRLRAKSGYMEDAMDSKVILDMLADIKEESGKVLQVFVKAEADPTGSIRGKRHTMNTDSDIHSTRHARAAVGGLVAGLFGDSTVYVSGGGEGQGPPGGGSLCIVYECE